MSQPTPDRPLVLVFVIDPIASPNPAHSPTTSPTVSPTTG